MFACQDTLLRRIILRDMYQFQARAVGGIYQLRKSAKFCASRDQNQTTHAN